MSNQAGKGPEIRKGANLQAYWDNYDSIFRQTKPVTYKELHEEIAGMGLDASFFTVSGINPDAPVKCNCKWDEGHESSCDIVIANEILRRRK